MEDLIAEIRACTACAEHLPHPPNPVFQLGRRARIAIVGQAPGIRAHTSGRPFTDPSGDRLRDWLGVDEATFYDRDVFAIAPTGMCFPGYDAKGSDLPPRKECAPLWRERIFGVLSNVEFVIVTGASAQAVHLGARRAKTLTETVRRWRAYGPRHIPLPHPSWRNNAWIKRHPWFAEELLPHLRERVSAVLERAP